MTASFRDKAHALVRFAREAGADFADALIQGAMELFGIDETVTFNRAAAERLGWTLLDA